MGIYLKENYTYRNTSYLSFKYFVAISQSMDTMLCQRFHKTCSEYPQPIKVVIIKMCPKLLRIYNNCFSGKGQQSIISSREDGWQD